MKSFIVKSAFIAACAASLIACEKTETAVKKAVVKPAAPGLLTSEGQGLYNHTGKYLKTIDTTCLSYLKYTTKLDISGLKNGESYNKISDGTMTITNAKYVDADNALIKYDPAPAEWWSNWNVKPFVESNNPPVLFQGHKAWTRLYLSKKCYVFGMEIGAQLLPSDNNVLTIVTSYSKDDINLVYNDVADVFQDITSPYSARLFAIKSDVPFDIVEIGYSSYVPHNYAIANIRYLTDKAIYEKHKND